MPSFPPNPRILDWHVSELRLGVRANNILVNANIRFVGDLVRRSSASLLRLPNCGFKTVREIKWALAAAKLRLGMDVGDWQPPPAAATFSTQDMTETARASLYLSLDDLNLSNRAKNILENADIRFVGDLISYSPTTLLGLPSCGRQSVTEIATALERLGLRLGTPLTDWDSEAAVRARAVQIADSDSPLNMLQRRLSRLPKATSLEAELRNLLLAVATERHVEIITKQLGWSGQGRQTLEAIGAEYGVTRERIRQIAARATARIGTRNYALPFLDKAVAFVGANTPAFAAELSKLLAIAGISERPFDVSGIASACEATGRKFDFDHVRINEELAYASPQVASSLLDIERLCRRMTSSNGCANFDALCDAVRVTARDRVRLKGFLELDRTLVWLDDDHAWLMSVATTRNRLINLISKVLSVAPNVFISELRRAVSRSRRLAIVPPSNVLARLVEYSGLGVLKGSSVQAGPILVSGVAEGSVEATLVTIFNSHGPILTWDRLLSLGVEAGINPTTVNVYVSNSPIIARLSRGIYSLVGAKIAPGTIEEIERGIASSRQAPEWGWTPKGALWFVVRASPSLIHSGSVMLPPFVAEYADGDWSPRVGLLSVDGTVKCRGRFMSGLRRPLSITGAEMGDTCAMAFEPASRTVDIFVGGDDLLDMMVDGDIPLSDDEDGA